MANISVETNVNAPDEIEINLVREDYLETSNNFRIFFEICLALSAAVLGNILSYPKIQDVPTLNWVFFVVMIVGGIATLILTCKNYEKAKSCNVEQ